PIAPKSLASCFFRLLAFQTLRQYCDAPDQLGRLHAAAEIRSVPRSGFRVLKDVLLTKHCRELTNRIQRQLSRARSPGRPVEARPRALYLLLGELPTLLAHKGELQNTGCHSSEE